MRKNKKVLVKEKRTKMLVIHITEITFTLKNCTDHRKKVSKNHKMMKDLSTLIYTFDRKKKSSQSKECYFSSFLSSIYLHMC